LDEEMTDMDKKLMVLETDTSVKSISAKEAFELISDKEKMYSYHLTRASRLGSVICYFQRSFESPALFYLF